MLPEVIPYCRNCFNIYALRYYLNEKLEGNSDNFICMMGKIATTTTDFEKENLFEKDEEGTNHLLDPHEKKRVCEQETPMLVLILNNMTDNGMLELTNRVLQSYTDKYGEQQQIMQMKYKRNRDEDKHYG